MRKNFKLPSQGETSIEGILLLGVVFFSILIAGGLFFTNKLPTPPSSQFLQDSLLCCDSGNGPNCAPISPTFTYNNPNPQYGSQAYGLLKSGVTLQEGGSHLKDSGQRFQGNPIIYNTSSDIQGECGNGKSDQIWNSAPNGPKCVPIPIGELLYVCKSNCHACGTDCYGGKNTIYDVYFRTADYPTPGVPAPIKDCYLYVTPPQISQAVGNAIVITPYPSHATLQLHTFEFISPPPQTIKSLGLSPYCKPALYLYPQKTEQVNVRINPAGKLNATIPFYPPEGWDVTANPSGNILYQNHAYDYLYYEAALPDTSIPSSFTGYDVAGNKLAYFFQTLLPKLGLNLKEQNQFTAYWMNTLPYSPYYKISIEPDQVLNTLSPLLITPQPDTVIRVTLYFQPESNPSFVLPPHLTPVNRHGFTVVEWGGIYKQDKNHPFTCLE